MTPFSTKDEATTRTYEWLQSNLTNGLLLTICRAILERDEAAVKAVGTEYFAGDYTQCDEHTRGCNRELVSQRLDGALRIGYAHGRGGNRNRTGYVLISDTRKTILYVMNDFDKQLVVVTGQVRQEQELAALTLDSLKQGLTDAVEALSSGR